MREFPEFRLVEKREHRLSRVISFLLGLLTLGKQSQFMTEVVTTLGDTVYVPANWDSRSAIQKYRVLRHEAVHLRQFKRHGFFLMALVYLFLPFPVVFAYGRARLEWEAYEETLAVIFELEGHEGLRSPALKEELIKQFTGANYAWMWPFPSVLEKWYAKSVEKIVK